LEEIFTTDTVHPRDRFDYWHDVACKRIVLHDCKSDARHNFFAHLQGIDVGGLTLLKHRSAAMVSTRTRAYIAKSSSDDVLLCRGLSGTSRFDQAGRVLALEPGGITLLDPITPYEATVEDGTEMMVAKFDRRELEARLGFVGDLTLLPLHAAPLGRLLSNLLDTAAQSKLPAPETRYVVHGALDLVAMCAGACVPDHAVTVSSRKAIKILQLREAIESRLGDPNLTPADIATAVGCSVRYANMLLAEHDMSVWRLVLKLRLERCRRALSNPACQHRTITDIALQWGFKNVAHFSSAFKNEFGVSPSECRSRAEVQ
jgi:AraC-like DNA-binding protein